MSGAALPRCGRPSGRRAGQAGGRPKGLPHQGGVLKQPILCLIAFGSLCFAQQPGGNAQIRIEPIRGHMYLIAGAGGNIVASVGSDGVLLVDSGLADNADKVLEALSRLNRQIANAGGLPTTTVIPPKPIRYIINTHLHADHTGGNE